MELEERAADPLAGGLMQGYQCGQLWGAALAAGTQAYRTFGKCPQAEARAMIAAQRIVESFRAQNKNIDCRAITGIDLSAPKPRMIIRFLIKSGPTGSCFGMAARCAKAAFDEINAAFSEEYIEAPTTPVSCSAMLAQKMGLSDLHTVMAAGFAGGIGLSGGACGAMGTAIWIVGMNKVRERAGNTGYEGPTVSDLIDAFAESTNHEFECSKIVGRKFENIDDHANYLRDGGCSKIIGALAAQGRMLV